MTAAGREGQSGSESGYCCVRATATCSIVTGTTPSCRIESSSAARGERSIESRRLTGPRSLIVTTTERPFFRLVTLTRECIGRLRCAAVGCAVSRRSPVAVSRPTCQLPYQDARPTSPTTWNVAGCRDAEAGATPVGRVAVLVARLGLLGEGSGREHESGEGHAKGSLHSHPHASPCCCNIAQRSGPAMRAALEGRKDSLRWTSSRILSARVGRGKCKPTVVS